MKRNSLRRMATVALAFLAPLTAGAGTSDKVSSWFDNMNYANVTSAGVYEGQSARYATLGGVSTRAPITYPFNFVQVQTPKWSAGCGGIDFYAGGFSAINADQFIENLRAIGQNAQSLAFMLAIQIVSPQLSGVMEEINSWAQKLNALNIDSCQAATAMMGGAMDLMGAEMSNCTLKRMSDAGEDWNDANYFCKTGGKRQQTKNSGDANHIDFVKGNLTWYVLMRDPFFLADPDFAEVVMNITGTVILGDESGSEDSRTTMVELMPAISDGVSRETFQNIYNALLNGSQAQTDMMLRRCVGGAPADPAGCTELTASPQAVSAGWEGLYTKTENLIDSIAMKIRQDQPLTMQERGLIGSTTVPLYRFLSAGAATLGTDQLAMHGRRWKRLIAEDILLRSVRAVIETVEQQAAMLPGGMSTTPKLKEYRDRLGSTLRAIAEMQEANEITTEDYLQFLEEIRVYARPAVASVDASYISAARWGK